MPHLFLFPTDFPVIFHDLPPQGSQVSFLHKPFTD